MVSDWAACVGCMRVLYASPYRPRIVHATFPPLLTRIGMQLPIRENEIELPDEKVLLASWHVYMSACGRPGPFVSPCATCTWVSMPLNLHHQGEGSKCRICTCIYSHVTAEMAGWFMENL